MNSFVIRHWLLVIGSLVLCMAGAVRAEVKVTAEISPNPITPNQLASLTVTVENGQLQQIPELTLPAPVTITGGVSTSNQISIINGMQTITTQMTWPVTATQPGTFKIPPQKIQVSGNVYATQELTLEVKDAAQMPKPNGPNRDNGLSQYDPILQMQMAKTEFYQGEVVPITATLYLPRTVQLRRLGLIEVEKSDFAIQRFPQQADQSLETLGRVSYIALTFRSTLSALKPGKSKIGPAKMEIMLEVPMAGGRGGFPFGFMQMESKKVTVDAVEIPVTVLPLPTEGKPKGFSGAVGDFTMQATSTVHDVTVGDPVAVELNVEGQGNFDALEAPKLSDPTGWKVYPARRFNVDSSDPNTADLMNRKIGFSTIIVPEKVQPAVPPFEFSFFSPRTKQYTTLRSQPIALNVKPSDKVAPPTVAASTSTPGATPPPPTPAPEADITDILMRIPAQPHWAMSSVPLLSDGRFIFLNVILFLCFIGLVGWTLFKRWQHQQELSADHELRKLWQSLQQSDLSEAEFYRRSAHYLQRIGGELPESVLGLLAKYEALNFAGPGAGSKSIDASEREQALVLLKQLKPKAALRAPSPIVATAALLILVTTAHAEISRYEVAVHALETKDYKGAQQQAEAILKEGDISPELFTLLGHAAYKQANPGAAAMWYQRAQLFPAAQPELRQNLRHLGEKIHFFSFPQNEMVQAFAFTLSRNQWALLAAIGTWLALFSIAALALGFLKPQQPWLIGALVAGLLVIVLGSIGWATRPDFKDLADLAFVTAPKAQAHTAATQVSGNVISVPPGSTVRKLEERGTWSYVEIPQPGDNLRGWLPTGDLVPVWPYDPAKLP